MKSLILIFAVLIVVPCFAQTECRKSNPIFKSDNYGTPKGVYSLGSNPEFPFLRNLSTPQQVVLAIKRSTNKHGATELNRILKDIGFANGAKDVGVSSVTVYNIPSGTIGNMGDGNFKTAYIKLMGEENIKSWKITSAKGCSMYILAKCGNAFYPTEPAAAPQAVAPVVIDTMKMLSLEGNVPTATKECDYCCYHYYRMRHWRRAYRYWYMHRYWSEHRCQNDE